MNDAAATRLKPNFRAQLREATERPLFQRAIMWLIVFNAATLGLETWESALAAHGALLHAIDTIVLFVFVVELAIRIYAHGLRFFRDPWNVFDFVVVGISLAPASETFSVLRALRVLRVFRLVSAVPRMRRVVGALLHALPGLASIAALLLLIFYVFAVMATKLFGERFPQWFGTLGDSIFSLFQIMTLEGWADMVRQIMEVMPQAWLFFVPFMLASTFTVLNLFIAIIVDSMQTLGLAEDEKPAPPPPDPALGLEIAKLRAEISELRRTLERS